MMSISRFRKKIYAALGCGVACLLSPFGWGFYCSPFPVVNMVLSSVFFLMVATAGQCVLDSWRETPSSARLPMLLVAGTLSIAAILIGVVSILIQLSTAHDQWIIHKKAVVIGLWILVGFVLQEITRKRVNEKLSAKP